MTVRTAVLINPGAGRSNGKGLALAGLLKGHGTVDLRVADSFGQVGYIIRELMNEGVTRLYISAGDGTVDAVLTLLAEAGYATPALQLGLLPHGTTNMTAADVGLRARSVTAQASFIATGNFNEQIQRHTMRISNALDNNVRHGMFLGVGAVAEAARYSQQVFNSRGIGGNTAPFAVLASAVMKTVFKRADPEDKNRFDRPFPISIEACGKTFSDGPQLLAISTTLSRLILNSRPFWGGGDGAIRTTIMT